MVGRTRVYISGSVSSDSDYREKFSSAERYLKSKGYSVVNPVKGEKEGKPWVYYIIKDIRKLLRCNTIYLLPDWGESKGAKLEQLIANALEMKMISGSWRDLSDYGYSRYSG